MEPILQVTALGANVVANNAIMSGQVTTANLFASGPLFSRGQVTGTSLFTQGQVTAANVFTSGQVTAANLFATGPLFSQGQVTSTSLFTQGQVTAANLFASGQVTAANLFASGPLFSQGQVTSTSLFTQGQVTAANLFASGQVTAANLFASSNITTQGQVTAASLFAPVANINNLSINNRLDVSSLNASFSLSVTGGANNGNTITVGNTAISYFNNQAGMPLVNAYGAGKANSAGVFRVDPDMFAQDYTATSLSGVFQAYLRNPDIEKNGFISAFVYKNNTSNVVVQPLNAFRDPALSTLSINTVPVSNRQWINITTDANCYVTWNYTFGSV